MLLHKIRFLLFCLLIAIPATIVVAKGPGPDIIPGELIIKIRSDQALQAQNQSPSTAMHRVTRFLDAYHVKSMHSAWKRQYNHLALRVLSRHGKSPSVLDEVKNDLSRIYRIHYDAKTDPRILARKLSRMPDVEYAEPVYIRHTTGVPNDTLYSKESAYLAAQNFPQAWDVSKGDTSVVIAIVDVGVDYKHLDLRNKMWRNLAEENGKPGVDDDGNGFVDDSIGWDFWESGPITSPVQDNNPIGDYSDHGTHVAGIAAAATNNTTGIAGTGYNCRFMAVKVGGTQSQPDAIGFGFEGIRYAMLNGADVINCSWGGDGGSRAEQDIINQATKLGVVVVCAAGNNDLNETFFPASYNHVLSVGSIGTSAGDFNVKSNFSNYGPYIDVMAAGYNIYSTVFNNGYGIKSGTSMATPMVSGLAGLIKAQHPNWSAYRIESQIRATATNIDSYNPNYQYELGHGRIDAYKAVTDSTPGLDVVSYDFVDNNGQKLVPGESGTLKIFITNYNITTKDAQFALTANQPNISISSPTTAPSVIATGDTTEVDFPVSFGSNYDLSKIPTFRLDMSDKSYSYSDFRFITYKKILYDVTQANNIQVSASSDGTIAYQDPYNPYEPGGSGFNTWDPNKKAYTGNYLFSSGLMLMANDSLLTDAVRSADSLNHGFKPENAFVVTPVNASETDGSGKFNTLNTKSFPYFDVHLQTYQFTDPSLNKTVFIKYTITNKSLSQATNVYVGLHNDWDLGDGSANCTGYLSKDSLLYVYDTVDQNEPYVAMAQLGNISSNLAIDNGYTGPLSRFRFGIYYDPTNPLYNGYTNEEKRNSLIAGDSIHTLTNTDVSVATASGPYTIDKDQSIVVGFVFAYGNSLTELQSQVEAARAKNAFSVSPITTGIEKTRQSDLPTETRLVGNYPNPFNPTTNIQYDLSKGGNVSITVYNLLGQKVTTLVDRYQRAGSYQVRFNGQNMSSGIYLIVLKTANHWQTRKMTLLK